MLLPNDTIKRIITLRMPKHVVVPYVENTLYSTNKYSCVRPVHTLYISYFIEHNGDDEPHERILHTRTYDIS